MKFSPRFSGDIEGTGSLAFWMRLASQEPLLTKGDEYHLWKQMQRACRQIGNAAKQLPAPCKRKVKRALGEKRLCEANWPIEKIHLFCEHVAAAFPRRFTRVQGKNREKLFDAFDDLKNAFSRFVRANLRLVIKVANTKNLAMPLLDMQQEGALGLMHAVEIFDGSRGFKFSTYAVWWISQTIDRALADQSRVIRIPVHGINKLMTIRDFIKDYIKDFGHPPTQKEVVASTGYTSEIVSALMNEGINVTSIDDIISSEDNSNPRSAILVNQKAVQPDQFIEQEAQTWAVSLLFQSLTDKERRVIMLRFGLDGEGPKTLEKVGALLKPVVTRERVRQIENKAKEKMRHAASQLSINAQLIFGKR